MEILDIIRFVRGYVEFEATGSFPERLINISLKKGIHVYKTHGDNGTVRGRVISSQYESLKKLGDRCAVEITPLHCRGIPFIYSNNKNRWGLLLGAVLFFGLCAFLSSFVWVVEVDGTPSVSEYKIRQALDAQGLYSGAWKGNLAPDTIERETMRDLGSFGWMSVNITGTVAKVSVSEKYNSDDVKPQETRPCNIKAVKDGQIVRMDIRSGVAAVKAGDAVTKGELLVSGVLSVENDADYLTPSVGEVFAKTEHTKTVSQPLKYTQRLPSGRVVERNSLNFLGINLPLNLTYIPSGDYSTECEYLNLIACGNTMPIGIYNEYCTEYTNREIKLSEEQAKESCLAQLALYEVFNLGECEITDRKLKHEIKDGCYILTAAYSCIEDIGEVSYIGIE